MDMMFDSNCLFDLKMILKVWNSQRAFRCQYQKFRLSEVSKQDLNMTKTFTAEVYLQKRKEIYRSLYHEGIEFWILYRSCFLLFFCCYFFKNWNFTFFKPMFEAFRASKISFKKYLIQKKKISKFKKKDDFWQVRSNASKWFIERQYFESKINEKFF